MKAPLYDEILAISQDPLVHSQGRINPGPDPVSVWSRKLIMVNNSRTWINTPRIAVALYNSGETTASMVFPFALIFNGDAKAVVRIRNIWQRRELGIFDLHDAKYNPWPIVTLESHATEVFVLQCVSGINIGNYCTTT